MSESASQSLNVKDILILKRFLEKGLREELFLPSERQSILQIHSKLNTICKNYLSSVETQSSSSSSTTGYSSSSSSSSASSS